MSSSRSSDTKAEGVGWEEERVRRMFPPALMKSSRSFGVSCGPRPMENQNEQFLHDLVIWYLSTLVGE